MMAGSVGHQLDQHWSSMLDGKLPTPLRGKEDCGQVAAINPNRVHAVGDPPGSDAVPYVLLLARGRNGPAVVAAKQDHLRSERRGKVQGHRTVAFRRSALAKVGHAATLFAAHPESVACAHRLRNLRRQRGRHSLQVETCIAVVHRHLPPLSSLISSTHALVNHLLDGEASVHEGALLSVLGPDRVLWIESCGGGHLRCLLAAAGHVE
mmetsp:Transcript_63359/g.137915  ORF Transcript_63359/g.137915 Transcript_63359/m.137915 type:complete len:208 (+) Transcript_63359:444-1067(+)